MLGKSRLSVVLVLVMLMGLMSGCASFTKNSYKSLLVASELYNTTMISVAEMEKTGVITAEKRLEVNSYARLYYDSYQAAVDALGAYVSLDSTANKEVASMAVLKATLSIATMVEKIKPYLHK